MNTPKENNLFRILAIVLAVLLISVTAGGIFLLLQSPGNTATTKTAADEIQTLDVISPRKEEAGTHGSITVSIASPSDKSKTAAPEDELTIDAPAVTMDKLSSVHASSELSENNMTHSAGRICDGRSENAWVEGSAGPGINESIVFTFDSEYKVSGMNIHAGYQKNSDIYYKNARPQSIKLTFSDGTGMSLQLSDICGPQNIAFAHPVQTSEISVMIESIYPGNKYEDLAISELAWY